MKDDKSALPFLASFAGTRISQWTLKRWAPNKLLTMRPEPLPQRVNRVRKLWEQSSLRHYQFFERFCVDVFSEAVTRHPPEDAAFSPLIDLVCNLYKQNDLYLPTFPEIDLSRSLTAVEVSSVEQALAQLETLLTHEQLVLAAFHESAVALLRMLDEHIPQTPSSGMLQVPLHALLGPAKETVHALAGAFILQLPRKRDSISMLAFANTTKQLWENLCRASGITVDELETKASKLEAPLESSRPADNLIDAYLQQTPLRDLLLAPIGFSIGKRNYPRHGICVARPGWGKSQLLGTLLREAVEDPDQRAVILIDPHGPLYAKAVERMPRDRLVCIDCDTSPPDLNIFDFGVSSPDDALNTFEFLISSLAGGLTEKQQGCIEPLFALLQQIDGATLETLHDIVAERPSKKQPPMFAAQIEKLDKIHRAFFGLFYGSGDFDITKAALQWKISRALSRPAFRKMFSATKNSVDIDALIKRKAIIVVKGGEKALGREGMRILLLYLLSQFYAAGKRREGSPEHTWHLAQMLIDEAHLVLQSNLIKPVLQELRKFNFSFFAATQLWDDVAQEVKPAILGATAIKVIGDVQRDDAEVFARDMHTRGEFIQSLRQADGSHAEWAFFITGKTDTAIRVVVPYGQLEAMPKQRGGTLNAPPSQPAYASAGADQTASSVPHPQQPASQPAISDIELAVKICKQLEHLFETRLGATGRGLHEKITSVKDKLPSRLVRPAYYVAFIRNGVLHKPDFTIRNRDRLLRNARSVEDHLLTLDELPADYRSKKDWSR